MKTQNIIEFTVQLEIQAPFFSAAQGGQQYGLDSSIQRDWNGSPALSGSAIRGLLRHSWQSLENAGLPVDIKQWLGHHEAKIGTRSQLSFSHWFTSENKKNATSKSDAVRYRIEISDQGTVKQGSLQVIESPFNTGESIWLEGKIWAQVEESQRDELTNALTKGLSWIAAIGGLKGVGYGKIVNTKVSVTDTKQENSIQEVEQTIANRFALELTFDRPICFAKPQKGKSEGNLFEASDSVPGAAIIAVLAQNWPQNERYLLDDLHVSHAFPCHASSVIKRPIPIPYSWAHFDNKGLINIALLDDDKIKSVPAFVIDWKNKQFAQAECLTGWPELSRLEETRTEINFLSRTSEKSKLFSTQSIDTREHVWVANVDLYDVAENKRNAVSQHIRNALKGQLAPFGKTDARATALIKNTSDYPYFPAHGTPSEITPDTKEVTITLVTDAELLFPIPQNIKSQEDWSKAYANVFEKLSPNTFQLKHQYCSEKAVGGNYLKQRFAKDKPYTPRLLTAAGSVFVLEVKDHDKAITLLEKWSAIGMPSLAGNDDWRNSPYRSHNGYGEIIINLQCPSQGATK